MLYPQAQLADIAAMCKRMHMIKSADKHVMIRLGARIANIFGDACLSGNGLQGPAGLSPSTAKEVTSLQSGAMQRTLFALPHW